MNEIDPKILALDFDGVVCDGLIEYFQSAWRAYQQIWSSENLEQPEALASTFYRLRPVIETGWEMPILLRAIFKDISEDEIWRDWVRVERRILASEELDPKQIEWRLDEERDRWIATDLESWLNCHRFYPGVIQKLRSTLNQGLKVIIITTKESRFVRQLLLKENLDFPESLIFGKATKRPKSQILQDFVKAGEDQIWFVEDRLKTLQSVTQHPTLDRVDLFLADWGYNTESDRRAIESDPRIHRLSLNQFAQDFTAWK